MSQWVMIDRQGDDWEYINLKDAVRITQDDDDYRHAPHEDSPEPNAHWPAQRRKEHRKYPCRWVALYPDGKEIRFKADEDLVWHAMRTTIPAFPGSRLHVIYSHGKGKEPGVHTYQILAWSIGEYGTEPIISKGFLTRSEAFHSNTALVVIEEVDGLSAFERDMYFETLEEAKQWVKDDFPISEEEQDMMDQIFGDDAEDDRLRH